ncbi:TATA box-binding protein-associated factor RNA polymerase I subunit A isoform X1 [Pelobates fuscus]|uniref:TATA box-binding protein-associated factor RNA polymerase I subunit A isoform X1 n=1 Tax=Pelobates fuscus TaxID=191477 RepID=UPI002FE44791
MEDISDPSSEEIDESNFGSLGRIVLPNKHADYSASKSNVNGVHQSADLCLSFLHKAICKNQWERAAGFMTSYVQTLEDRTTSRQRQAPEIIWRLGTEILLNHPKSTVDELNLFHERMKNIGVKNFLQISLEQAFYLLCNGQIEDASRVLMVAESWRFGTFSASQNKFFKLIQAYRALLDYRAWLDKKASVTESDSDFASHSSTAQEIFGLYKQATTSFQEILRFPGVWDPFVQCYVDLLESSGEKHKVEELLEEYAYNNKNPANPNAHVYLYEFLKRNEATSEKLINVLKILHSLVPSHRLMLEFSQLLAESDCEKHRKLAVQVAFDLLDFSSWKEDVNAWKCLERRLMNALIRNHKAWVMDEWGPRKAWWPAYHFSKCHAREECEHSEQLALRKGMVAGLLLGRAHHYFSAFCILGSKIQTQSLQSMKKFVNAYSCANPD